MPRAFVPGPAQGQTRRDLATWPGALALSLAVLLAVSGAGLSGCESGSPTAPPVPLDSIYIASPVETLVVSASVQLTYVAFDTTGAQVPSASLTWSSNDPGIAAVDTRGVVIGLSEGEAIITATGGGATSNPETLTVLQGFGWVSQEAGMPTVNNLNGVHFVDRMTGWAVGDLGTIVFTQNGGLSWVQQTSFSTSYRLNAVHFVNPDDGFVVGSLGRMVVTDDGGDTWTPFTVSAVEELYDVHFATDSVGFAVGDAGVILRTVDAGASWERLTPAVTGTNLRSVWGVEVADTVRVWACGEIGTIVGTMDGGETWSIVTPSITTDALRAVVRRSVDEAVAVGLNNRIGLTTPDPGGPIWSLGGASAEFSNFYGVAWPVVGRTYAVGINQGGIATVQVSLNGGVSWALQTLPPGAPIVGNELRAVSFVDADYGWAVGRAGLVVHTATGGF